MCFRLKEGPASESAHDIYPSTVINQGAESRGCTLCIIDAVREKTEIAVKHVSKKL